MSREDIRPILEAIPAARQRDARHYGAHPYFTRRPANVVRAYIERYSVEGDTVLDPFGGTGVTAIEALLLGRIGVHNDLNPFANFIAANIADTTLPTTAPLLAGLEAVRTDCASEIARIEGDETLAKRWLTRLPLPENIRLPRNSDAEFFYDMFTPRQLAGLARIKASIDARTAGAAHDLLLLAWSAAIAKLNKTFLSAKGRAASRGGSSIFSIYRYKLAKEQVELPIWKTFESRALNIVRAKDEVLKTRDYWKARSAGSRTIDSCTGFRCLAMDACRLVRAVGESSADYIFTDPPYGAFISYLDLSILWNHWLGFPITKQARKSETIVGGELGLSEDHYRKSLRKGVLSCCKMLKPDRWMSIVFQHWEVSYFEAILAAASDGGLRLEAAITQTGDVIWSMHKKKNSANVLAGEMILTFYKPAAPAAIARVAEPAEEPDEILDRLFDSCLGGRSRFTSELLLNQVVLGLWRRNALKCLSLDRRQFQERLLARGWQYDPRRHEWFRGSAEVSAEPPLFQTKNVG